MSRRAALLLGVLGLGALVIARRASAAVGAVGSGAASGSAYYGIAPDTSYTPPANDQFTFDTGASTAGFGGWVLDLGNSLSGAINGAGNGGGWFAMTDMTQFSAALAGPGAPYAPLLAAAEARYNIPGQYLARMAYAESHFRADIINGITASSAGALGIMQFVPAAHPELTAADMLNPAAAIPAAGKYLATLFNHFGDWDLAVAAYNWGPGNVQKAIDGQRTPPAETVAYVQDVTGGDIVASIASNGGVA